MYASTLGTSSTSSSTTFPRITFPGLAFSGVYNASSSFGNISTLMLVPYLAKTRMFTLKMGSSVFKKGLLEEAMNIG
jgi:hypothetical protein